MSIGNGSNESSVEGNKVNKKIPLSKAGTYETNVSTRIFKVEKDIVAKNGGKLWIDTDFKTNYQKDEMVPDTFSIMVQTHGAFGARIEITEEQLEAMLNHVREEKKKVYCFEGCH